MVRSFRTALALGLVCFAVAAETEHTGSMDLGGGDEEDEELDRQIAELKARKAGRGRSIADTGPKLDALAVPPGVNDAHERVASQAAHGAAVPARGINRDDWVRIILEDNDNIPPTGQPFGINGVNYILMPGVEANVPPAIISILNDAVMETPIRENGTQRLIGWRRRLRFPYHRVG